MPKFNPQQLEAIQARGSNLLVSAAAGSGKTTVLVERILALLGEGVDPAGLLVVTFTKAAAAEMRDRLRVRLEALAPENPALQAALDRLPLATISTIHAFCKQLLDRHFDKAGLEAGFRVMEEEESDALRAGALDEALDEVYLDDGLAEGLAALGSMDKLRVELVQLYEFLMSQPFPWKWLEEALDHYRAWSQAPERSPWQEELESLGEREMAQAASKAREALEMAQAAGSAYEQVLRQDVELLELAASPPHPWSSFPRLPSIRKQNKGPEDEEIKRLRDGYKSMAERAMDQLRTPDPLERQRLARMLPALEALCACTRRFAKIYEEAKKEAAVVDFSDLEQRSLRLLQDEALQRDVQQRYSQVFVDEYQDSSAVQEAILRRVAGENNRFLVGDVKQSIYRFRQAEPSIFLDYLQKYAAGDGGRLVSLNRNFRSNPGVLEAANLVFSTCMRGGDAEVLYDAQAALVPGVEGAECNPVRLSLVSLAAAEGEGMEPDLPAGQELPRRLQKLEALNAARLVQESLGLPVRDGEGSRPASFRDIVILLRSPRSLVRDFMDTLSAQGIPVYADAGGEYFQAWEVRAALDYLTALDNPRKDVPLLGALRGVGGFASQELAQLRLMGRELSWYACLRLYQTRGEDPALQSKTTDFLNRLWAHRRLSRQARVSETLRAVLEDSGFVQRCLGLPYGRTRQANLQALCLRATAFDGSGDSLADFLRQNGHGAKHSRRGDTPTLTERDDVVRIMSVHKSKGLEFPIVIGCGLGRRFNQDNERDEDTGARSDLYLDERLGLGLGFFDPKERVKADTVACRAVQAKKRRQSVAEEMRVLYVLMTRPKDHLLLSAAVNSVSKAAEDWRWNEGQAGCPLDWIGRALLAHPDGQALRQGLRQPVKTKPHPSRWQVELLSAAQLLQAGEVQTPPDLQGVLDRLAQAPAYGPDPFALPGTAEATSPAPQKQSVLQSIHWGEKDVDFIHTRPSFLQKERSGLTPAERGSAMHELLRQLRLEELRGLRGPALRKALDEQLQALAQDARLSQQQAQAVEMEQVALFLEGALGRALLSSGQVLREQPFVAKQADGGLVQGIIDLCFETQDGWVLVDFKTDRRGLGDAAVRQRHGPQVESYAAAMQKAGLRVIKKTVYLLAVGREVEL